MRHIRLDITESTNRDARELASEADFGPIWITATQQLGGRGRNGREWISPAGNFYGSYLFPTELSKARLGQYSFVAALAVFDALSELYPAGGFSLKWPNDTLLDGAKISGLLLETGTTHHQAWVIVGIGINLVTHPENLSYAATDLMSVSGETVRPELVLTQLNRFFEKWAVTLEQSGFSLLRDAWLNRAHKIPGPVRVNLPDDTFEGEAIDLGQDGALHVRLASGTIRKVHAGDVFPG